MRKRTFTAITTLVLAAAASAAPAPPAVGEAAPDFALNTPDGRTVRLNQMREKAPVVLVVLRGYPGYQCPMCTRQVADLRSQAREIRKAGAEVVMVYPGGGNRAKEFMGSTPLPPGFTLVTDPEYRFTNTYRLRWDAPRETAYPATFIIDRTGKIRFARVSRSHGDRVPAAEVVQALTTLR